MTLKLGYGLSTAADESLLSVDIGCGRDIQRVIRGCGFDVCEIGMAAVDRSRERPQQIAQSHRVRR
jgi:hypothetical protein